jgi:hypothetical protein
VATNPRVRSKMSGSEEKIDGSDYHVREVCRRKLDDCIALWRYIYIGAAYRKP